MQRIILSLFAFALLAGLACKKGDVVSDFESLGIGSYVTLVKTGNTRIDYSNLNTSEVSITVREKGTPVDKIKIYVTKGTATLDKANWKLVKEVPYAGDSVVLSVKATEIAAALGIPVTALETGATYTLYNQLITKEGKTHDIANTFSEFASLSAYNMALTWAAVVVCPFNATGFAGDFEVVQDGWGDFAPGEVVTVAAGPGANQISITAYPSPAYGSVNRKPIVVSIDPATGVATVASQVYGDYPSFGLTNVKVRTVGTNNYVFSCVGTIDLRLNHTADQGNQGDYTLRLKKK